MSMVAKWQIGRSRRREQGHELLRDDVSCTTAEDMDSQSEASYASGAMSAKSASVFSHVSHAPSVALSGVNLTALPSVYLPAYSLLSAPGSPSASVTPSTHPLLPADSPLHHAVPSCFSPATPKRVDSSMVLSPFGFVVSKLCGYQPIVRQRKQHAFIMRHAERADMADPDWARTASRPWDPPLSEQGRIQAYQVGARIRREGWRVTRVVCSPYLRCVETAVEVTKALTATDEDDYSPSGPGYRGSSANLPGEVPALKGSPAVSIGVKRHIMAKIKNPDPPSKRTRLVMLRNGIKCGADRRTVKACLDYAIGELRTSALLPVREEHLLLPRCDLEAMFPAGSVRGLKSATSVLPPRPEEVSAGLLRLLATIDCVCEELQDENVLFVTHAEALHASILRCRKKANVYNVAFGAYAHLERTVYADVEDADDRGVSQWTLATRSGSSGVYYSG